MASQAPQSLEKAGTTAASQMRGTRSLESLNLNDIPLEDKNPAITHTSIPSTPTTTQINPWETDIEAIATSTTSTQSIGKSSKCRAEGTDCQVWPGHEHWKRKAKLAKLKRHSCNCLANMSKRNRIIAKILIGLLIIGIAVGVGVGLSKPLGAAIWRDPKQ